MANKDSNSPAYESKAYREQCEELQIVRDVRAGTLNLRKLGTKYLRMEEAEDSKDYQVRNAKAILFNALDRALQGLVGLVFRKEPELEEDVPEAIRGREAEEESDEVEGLAETIDQAGTHWTVFAKELFTDAMEAGHAFLYVDAPPYPQRVDGQPATLEDLRLAKWRPYWVRYTKDQAINWRYRAGKLEQITFKEISIEPDGLFGEVTVTRYRVLRPGSWQLFREITDKETQQISIVPDGEGPTPFNEIPVAVIYTRKCGDLVSRPPLLDLAIINLAHYAAGSDYRTYLHICSRPILWFRNKTKKQVEPIGAYTFFEVGPDGAVEFAETTGASLEAARTDLQDMQDQMAILGISMLAKKTPNKTATEEMLDSVKEESDLATAARSLKDGIEAGLKWTAIYIDQKAMTGGSVDLGCSMEDLVMAPDELRAYNEMAGRIFSTQTVRQMVANAKARFLPEDYSEEREQKLLAKERAAAAKDAMDIGAAALGAFDRGAGEDLPPDPGVRDAGDVAKLVTAAGALIRSGFEPQAALKAVGLDPIEHLGLLPVTLQEEVPAQA